MVHTSHGDGKHEIPYKSSKTETEQKKTNPCSLVIRLRFTRFVWDFVLPSPSPLPSLVRTKLYCHSISNQALLSLYIEPSFTLTLYRTKLYSHSISNQALLSLYISSGRSRSMWFRFRFKFIIIIIIIIIIISLLVVVLVWERQLGILKVVFSYN